MTRLSQVAFAREAGLDSSALASYEHARAPLRYDLALRLCSRFDINQRWLAEGKLPMRPYFDVSRSFNNTISPNSLFSSIYDKWLKPDFEKRFHQIEGLTSEELTSDTFDHSLLDRFHPVAAPQEEAFPYQMERIFNLNLRRLPPKLRTLYFLTMVTASKTFMADHLKEVLDYLKKEKSAAQPVKEAAKRKKH